MICEIHYFKTESHPAIQVKWDDAQGDALKAAEDGLAEQGAQFAIVYDEDGRNLGYVGSVSTNRPWPETPAPETPA